MPQINVQNLTFAYEGSYDNIFEDVSFTLDTDWKLGFIGRNGRGKTTFLRLLQGAYRYEGTITSPRDFVYFPYDTPDMRLDTAETARRVITGGAPSPASYEDWELEREISLLEMDTEILSRPFGTLSNGERTKTLLAALFLSANAFLLIDEPTNHLDIRGRQTVSRYLSGKRGYILVSHDRAFLDGCVDHILSINKTNIEVVRGNFSSWLVNKERRDAFELTENEKLKKEVKRLEQTAREKAKWADKVESTKKGKGYAEADNKKGHRSYVAEKSRRMQQRRKNLERRQETAIREKSELLKDIETAEDLKITQPAYHTDRLVSLKDVSISYGGKTVCGGVSFQIERGDRIALVGRNGSGKTSIIKLILGEEIDYTGEFTTGSRLVVSYVPQDTSFLYGSLKDFIREHNIDEPLFKAILRKLDFSREQFDKDLADFSAGQKKKALIAKSLCEKAHLLIWDEPLNYIDIYSRLQIEQLIIRHKPTILFVEHDGAFCESTATKTVRLEVNCTPALYG